MARRRGLSIALQTALGGLAGGAQGYVQQQELERKRQQEKAAAEERQAMNLASLFDRDFMTPEQFARQRDELKVTEPAQRLTIGGQELVRPRTPGESAARRELMRETMAAKSGTQEGKSKQSAIAAALNAQGSRISPADRALIEAGLLDVKDALPRRGGEGTGTASVMRDINDQVARFIAANMGRTRKVYDAEQRMEVERPIDVRAEADQLRKSLLELYGLRVATPNSAGGASRTDSTTTRASRPLEFTTTTGRTYRLPEE